MRKTLIFLALQSAAATMGGSWALAQNPGSGESPLAVFEQPSRNANPPPERQAPASPPAATISTQEMVEETKRMLANVDKIVFDDEETRLAKQIRLMELRLKLQQLMRDLRETTAAASPTPPSPAQPPTDARNIVDIPRPPPIRLIGIVSGPQGRRAEFFADGYRRLVREGQEVRPGEVVEKIESDKVTIRTREGRVVLVL